MGIFGNRNKVIPFKDAMKYAQSYDYTDYEFIPVDENDFTKGFRIQAKEAYKGIYRKCNYNDYQNTKGYKKSRRNYEEGFRDGP